MANKTEHVKVNTTERVIRSEFSLNSAIFGRINEKTIMQNAQIMEYRLKSGNFQIYYHEALMQRQFWLTNTNISNIWIDHEWLGKSEIQLYTKEMDTNK